MRREDAPVGVDGVDIESGRGGGVCCEAFVALEEHASHHLTIRVHHVTFHYAQRVASRINFNKILTVTPKDSTSSHETV